MICRACGSADIGYDPNPHGLEVIHTCLFGAEVTGEPGACRCRACGSLDVDVRTDAERELEDLQRAVAQAHALIAHWRLRRDGLRQLDHHLIAEMVEVLCFELEAVLPPKVENAAPRAQTPPVVARHAPEGVRTGSSPEGPQAEPCPLAGEDVKP